MKKVNSNEWIDTVIDVNDDGYFSVCDAIGDDACYLSDQDCVEEWISDRLTESDFKRIKDLMDASDGLDMETFTLDGEPAVIVEDCCGRFEVMKKYKDYLKFGDWIYKVFWSEC